MKISKLFSNKIFKIIFGLFKFIVFGILFLYVSFIILQRFTNNSSLFGYRVFNVATGSMIPVYEINDVIVVKDVDVDTLKVGDDVAYRGNRSGLEGKIITHRIIKIDQDPNSGNTRFFTKGINTENEDPSISGDQILGKVEGKLIIINELNHVIKSNMGFFFLIFCPLVLVIALEIAQSVIEMKIEKNEIKMINDKKKKDKNTDKEIDKEKNIESVKEETVEKTEEVLESQEEDIEIL